MSDMQNEMLQRITRVEEKVNNMDEKLDRVIRANETALEALQQAKSAHHRLDQIEDNQKWLWRTIAGAFLVAVAGFIISGGFSY